MRSCGKIFLLDDDELILSMLSRVLKKEGYEVLSESSTRDAVNGIKSFSPDVVMLDIRLPDKSGMDLLQEIKQEGIDTQVIMLTADDTAETAVKAMKFGAVDYLTKPFNQEEIKIVIRNALEKESLKQEVAYLRKVYSDTFQRDLIGCSGPVRELTAKVEKLAEARVSTILIMGESGTGKEVVARNIHHLMHGKQSSSGYVPFIWINCAAMPETILESELFGYEKGSFTDAKSDKKGLFERADGGTILLDEIGDMKTELQSKLLRVLEERTIRRIGGNQEIPVDLTVIATTNKNLARAVQEGGFRQDLFYRLSIFYLHLVPLRERREDIPLLARYFLEHFAMKYNKKNIKDFSPEAIELLTSYDWPGNVRELRNLVERVVVLENEEIITPRHLPNLIFDLPVNRESSSSDRFVLPDSGISLEEVEKDLVLQALQKAKNNNAFAAKLLNISYDSLRYKLKKFNFK